MDTDTLLAISAGATFLLALAAFWAIWQNYSFRKKDRELDLANQKLDEIRYILTLEIAWYRSILRLRELVASTKKEQINIKNEIGSKEHRSKDKSLELKILSRKYESFDEYARKLQNDLDEMNKYRESLIPLLQSIGVKDKDFNRLSFELFEAIDEYHKATSNNSIIKKLIKKLEELHAICIILKK